MQKDPKKERTVVIIKPDAVQRGLIGEIIARIEKRGLKVISLQMYQATRSDMNEHYPKDPAWIERLGHKSLKTYSEYGWDPIEALGTDDPKKIGAWVRDWILDFMTSGPIVKMVVEGIHSVDMVRKLVGNSIPAMADMGTVRGDYSVDSAALANMGKRSVHNLVHASETTEEAANELKLWFKPTDIHEYARSEDGVLYTKDWYKKK